MFHTEQCALLAFRFVRMVAHGIAMMMMVEPNSSSSSGNSSSRIEFLHMLSSIVSSIIFIFATEKYKRKHLLKISAILTAAVGVLCLITGDCKALLLVSSIAPSGLDLDPFKVAEDAALAQVTPGNERVLVFAAQSFASVSGAVSGILMTLLMSAQYGEEVPDMVRRFKYTIWFYILCSVCNLLLCRVLTDRTEFVHAKKLEKLSQNVHEYDYVGIRSESLMWMFCMIFGVDFSSIDIYTESLVDKYAESGIKPERALLLLFSKSHVAVALAAAMIIPSALLTKYLGSVAAIGILNAGAGLFTILIPTIESNKWLVTIGLLRELFCSSGTVPRQVFLASVTAGRDSAKILGIVNTARILTRYVGPKVITGIAAISGASICFYILGALELGFAGAVYKGFGRP